MTSLVVLLLANLVPVVGVLLLDWSVATILALYWIENGIVGLLNVPKILLARGLVPQDVSTFGRIEEATSGSSGGSATGPVLASFFLVHYGIFWLVHGAVVFSLPFVWPGPSSIGGPLAIPFGGLERLAVLPAELSIAAVGLGLSHALSFGLNFLEGGEYLAVSPYEQMFRPYGRVVVLHVAIVVGGMLVAALGQPLGLILVLVGAKTLLDLRFHLREHRRARGVAGPTTPTDWLRT